MSLFMHTVRWVIGLAMLGGAAMLAQPFAAAVCAARGGPEATATPAWLGVGTDVPVELMGSGGHAIPDTRRREAPPAAVVAEEPSLHAPPPPPSPLPASGLDLSPASPPLAGAYRSTVEIPPPPLLDVQTPPPLAAGWSVHDVARSAPQGPPIQRSSVPATYVVRDGDDLTGIALTIYGHAGAATAIWEANRERLPDPQLLPIGLALRLPPSWSLPASAMSPSGAAGGSIEPAYASRAGARLGVMSRETAVPQSVPPAVSPGSNRAAELAWLQRPAAPESSATLPPSLAATPVPGNRPATVRVGVADSLETIADRFYGDRGMAVRIWQANRDRLRSPDLIVPGLELRLP